MDKNKKKKNTGNLGQMPQSIRKRSARRDEETTNTNGTRLHKGDTRGPRGYNREGARLEERNYKMHMKKIYTKSRKKPFPGT